MFFNKKNNIKIWSVIDGLEKIVPIEPAIKYIPEWFKKPDKIKRDQHTDVGSVKNCPSFIEYFKNGFVVPLWCDLKLIINKDRSFQWFTPSKQFTFSYHTEDQYLNLLPKSVSNNYSIILKPDSPWRVKTPKGYSIKQFPMYYHFNEDFEVLPGYIWSDINHELNTQMVIKKYGEIFIPKGTPLALYVPYKREKFEYVIEENTLENQKIDNINRLQFSTKFKNSYRELQKKQTNKYILPK